MALDTAPPLARPSDAHHGRPTVESRLDSHSFVSEPRGRGRPSTGNLLLHGENLQVLRTLAPALDGQVRCIYIDPPYNNQEHYRHYDDVGTHEGWIRGLRARLDELKPLLRRDGSIWISIDDREVHYLKVLADEVFGRACFVTTVVWQQRTTRENRRAFSNDHEYILVYAADPREFTVRRNRLPPNERLLARYRNPDDDPRGPWQSVSANVQDGHATPGQLYVLEAPNGRRYSPPPGRCWVYTEDRMKAEIAAGNVSFGRSGLGTPRLKRFLGDGAHAGLTPNTLWLATEVGTNDQAKKALLADHSDHALFDTPKPEALLERILAIASDPGDLVLDAFAGSGTTSVVAHRLHRSHVSIEQNRAAAELAAARIAREVELRETGGGDDATNGFDYYRLA